MHIPSPYTHSAHTPCLYCFYGFKLVVFSRIPQHRMTTFPSSNGRTGEEGSLTEKERYLRENQGDKGLGGQIDFRVSLQKATAREAPGDCGLMTQAQNFLPMGRKDTAQTGSGSLWWRSGNTEKARLRERYRTKWRDTIIARGSCLGEQTPSVTWVEHMSNPFASPPHP